MSEEGGFDSTAVSPPLPTSSEESITPISSSTATVATSPGSRLLTLLRLLDKKKQGTTAATSLDGDDDDSTLDDALELLQTLTTTIRRRGLLQGDVSRAERVFAKLSSNNSNTSSNNPLAGVQDSSSAKRNRSAWTGRKVHNSSSSARELTIHLDRNDTNASTAGTTGGSLDEQLFMNALFRILGGVNAASLSSASDETKRTGQENDSSDKPLTSILEQQDMIRWPLVALAADACTAMSEFVKIQNSRQTTNSGTNTAPDLCVMAEYELLATAGKPLLSGLHQAVCRFMAADDQRDDWASASLDNEGQDQVVYCCLRAACSLVGFFGTKLSRSTALLSNLRRVGEQALIRPGANMCLAGTMLLAALPYCGGTEGASPSTLWDQAMSRTMFSLSKVLDMIAPADKNNGHDSASNERGRVEAFVLTWLDQIQQESLEPRRVESLMQLVRALLGLLSRLLARDSLGTVTRPPLLIECSIDISFLLTLMERMLAFPSVCEALYHGTKKRLRLETIDSGLLSPHALAATVANQIKILGLELLDQVVAALGAPALLPYGRRFIQCAQVALLTSLSTPLRKVMDPVSAIHMDGKRRRWLHTAVVVRTAALETFRRVVEAFGTDPQRKRERQQSSLQVQSTATSSPDVTHATKMICGCLVEVLSDDLTTGDTGDWGSFIEQAKWAAAAADCLAMCLQSGGEFYSLPVRGLVDSVVTTCMTSLKKGTSITAMSFVREAFFKLSVSCICTPWQDGSSCSISSYLKATAEAFQEDHDIKVAAAARHVAQLCSLVAHPRCPPIKIVTRSSYSSQTETLEVQSSDAISSHLQLVTQEMKRSRQQDQESNGDQTKRLRVNSTAPEASLDILQPATADIRQQIGDDKSVAGHSGAVGNHLEPTSPPFATIAPTGQQTEPRILDLNRIDDEQNSIISSIAVVEKPAEVGSASSEPASVFAQHGRAVVGAKKDDDDDDDDDYFPEIVDCEPDIEDT